MSTKEADWNTPLDTGGEAFELLRNARKAWIYTYIRHNAETTTDDVVDSLEIPQRTAYDYINDLESAGFIEQSNGGRPARYTAREIDLQLVQDDVQRQITPALIEAIARREKDGDIDTYIERHGLDGLAVALEYAREYVDGSVTHRIMAREQDLSPLKAAIILDALSSIVEE
ncbi:DUF7437 domain-containing protein [Natronorubrum sulfidifaciens]|uniref:Transcriptional regulator, TrmB n=1 Tax=Natronorubrum sulfidifaciens JCM 14089 TaxID=1230460 RepID=L9VZU7_9EURY|nr:helix-turn-helix domain-containing protein [Natronorubrum sulfidifaciens]ELY41578.1 transcriptional regulator, TrmB [Natronorubrum sulfidifaciens JCM 14089]